MERQRAILNGIFNGEKISAEFFAHKDENGVFLELAMYPTGTPDEEIKYVFVRPDGLAEFGIEYPQMLDLLLKGGIHAINEELNRDEKREFTQGFMAALQKEAKKRGTWFGGPVGTIEVNVSVEPPKKTPRWKRWLGLA